jgi:8-oxo-dGTP pyrophosphatase MutT (NUDIX family)
VSTLDFIAQRLEDHSPVCLPRQDRRIAAVTLALRHSAAPRTTGESLEVLFIERAIRDGDPWSGHMAFPGGRMDPEDESERHTAVRETLEEVGLGLESARYLGQLDDLSGLAAAASNMVVSAHVFHVDEPADLVVNHEVAQAFWFPLHGLLEPRRHVRYPVSMKGREVEFPGIVLGEDGGQVVWGLTYRFLQLFIELMERSFPAWERGET